MTKILFVCHGNICRSPMAEFVMKKLVADAGRSEEFYISSCATSREEIFNGIGNPIYPPAQCELKKQGIPFDSDKRAVQLRAEDYGKYDYIIAMDSLNIRNINRIIADDRDNKIYKLMSFAGSDSDVADPWFSNRFDIAFNDILNGCMGLLEKL